MAKKFDYSLDYEHLDLRKKPELYTVGRGEQGVLLVEPYKSEILPHWRFKTPEIAKESSEKIYNLFMDYKKSGDFIGMDMARKFLQMGYTRARRYTNHKGGRKYSKEDGSILPYQNDPVKAESAAIFKAQWEIAKTDEDYIRMKKEHQDKYEKEDKKQSPD
ncbi:DUF4385 domain-containing protein [Paenibacillus chitinolyticus]|uniref:DUF4385 domain-containing protein n=1 Tax=Paenibacillus chitinolyticus TaxID=79263 RepID=A0A410WPP0_9BACL|nr:DUF4385 domain-containing protein [Paenibacillus chitinolyticus]MCY9590831.1 DUF4385 domain-containing protein [Paenibacillus chitinolyticus]MCY9598738.1 DUF4385 domain-containing protein [Paenibacillus chitinolyticus]QAV16277.1 DUF4385 domain-containing protein [Paenibacillus chitinolyticus]